MDQIERTYLLLALSLERHFEGFVDGYFGPPELKAEAQAGDPRPLDELAREASQLLAAIEDSDYDPQRQDFLWRQTRAMAAVVRNLSGDPLSFDEEVEHYFDILPEHVHETTFEAAHAVLEQELPGDGSLLERLTAWRKSLELAPEHIMPAYELARVETRRRTLALFDLPVGEDVSLHLVSDKPWSGYNWYLGGFKSRIELNTDLPTRGNSIVPLLAHEAYAGHHTEHALKEALLYHDQGRAEHAIQLLLAPECPLSEGIANSAIKIIFDDGALAGFLRDELYPRIGLGHVDVERQLRIEHAAEDLRGVAGNAALLLHREGRPADEVQRYIERYSLRLPNEAAQTLRFIGNPLFRSYIFNYTVGQDLLAPLLKGPDAARRFYRLLTEPFTPSQVRQLDSEQA